MYLFISSTMIVVSIFILSKNIFLFYHTSLLGSWLYLGCSIITFWQRQLSSRYVGRTAYEIQFLTTMIMWQTSKTRTTIPKMTKNKVIPEDLDSDLSSLSLSISFLSASSSDLAFDNKLVLIITKIMMMKNVLFFSSPMLQSSLNSWKIKDMFALHHLITIKQHSLTYWFQSITMYWPLISSVDLDWYM